MFAPLSTGREMFTWSNAGGQSMPWIAPIPRASPALAAVCCSHTGMGISPGAVPELQPVQREFVSVECQCCRGASPSEGPRVNEAAKEWHSAGSTHSFSTLFLYSSSRLLLLSVEINSVHVKAEWWSALHSAPKILLERPQTCAGCRKNYFIMGAQRSSAKN